MISDLQDRDRNRDAEQRDQVRGKRNRGSR
jgi:hypothetical protein